MNMLILIILLMLLKFLLAIFITPVLAAGSFTVDDVAEHSTVDDCYMIFEESVYDFTEYLQEHKDIYSDIDAWCGEDMTEDFKTKDGLGRDHKPFSYATLTDYYVGDVSVVTEDNAIDFEIENSDNVEEMVVQKTIEESTSEEVTPTKKLIPYNFAIPCFGTLLIYAITGVFS